MLAFARRQELDPVEIDAGTMLRNLSEMLERMLGEMVKVETSTTADLWPCVADEDQVESALLNLAVNARDAMPGRRHANDRRVQRTAGGVLCGAELGSAGGRLCEVCGLGYGDRDVAGTAGPSDGAVLHDQGSPEKAPGSVSAWSMDLPNSPAAM